MAFDLYARMNALSFHDACTSLLERLEGVQSHGDYWTARCPAHEDDEASLSLTKGSKVPVVMKCHAGCDYDAILSALEADGLDTNVLRPQGTSFPEKSEISLRSPTTTTYTYADDDGLELYRVIREAGKAFRREHPKGANGGRPKTTLYRRPYLKLAREKRARVYVVEGEKDVETLVALGLEATTSGSATSWKAEFAPLLEGCQVIILPDNDEPGLVYAEGVHQDLPHSRILKLPGLGPKEDVTDWLAHGHTIDELARLVDGQSLRLVVSTDRLQSLGHRLQQPVRAIPTPFDTWNQHCGGMGGYKGLAMGWNVVVAGPSGNGKTRLARQMVRYALEEGYSAGYIALEGGEDDFLMGLVSLGDPLASRLRPGPQFLSAEWQRMADHYRALCESRDVHCAYSTRARELAQVLSVVDEMADNGAQLVVVDYLQLVRVDGSRDIYGETRAIADALKERADDRGIVLVALSQFNRGATSGRGKDGKPTSDDRLSIHGLAGGSAVENNADQVLIIDNRHAQATPGETRGILDLAKNRHGSRTTFDVLWSWNDYTIKQPPIVSFGRVNVD